MKSASQMSLEIRRKKKAMQDNPSVVDLSGIPMDKTDEDIMEQDSMTAMLGLDHNTPKMRDEEPSEKSDEMADEHDEAPEKAAPGMDEAALKRKARLAKMMSR